MAETVTITYAGPALETGLMPVRDLAPALVAFADAINDAHQLVAPGATLPGVNITAVSQGSFTVSLIVSEPNLLGDLRHLFSGDDATAAANAIAIVSVAVGSVVGAIRFVKRLRGRRIRSIENLPQPGWVLITLDDGRTFELPTTSVDLARRIGFRHAVRDLMAPLSRDGVDSLAIKREDATEGDDRVVEVQKEDLDAFEVPVVPDEMIVDTTRDAAVRLLNVGFGENYKWRVHDGDQAIWVTVEDLGFRSRVEANVEAFTAGDTLRVKLRTRQYQGTDNDITNDHAIVEVLEHISGHRQVPLPMWTDEVVDPDDGEQDEGEPRDVQ